MLSFDLKYPGLPFCTKYPTCLESSNQLSNLLHQHHHHLISHHNYIHSITSVSINKHFPIIPIYPYRPNCLTQWHSKSEKSRVSHNQMISTFLCINIGFLPEKKSRKISTENNYMRRYHQSRTSDWMNALFWMTRDWISINSFNECINVLNNSTRISFTEFV